MRLTFSMANNSMLYNLVMKIMLINIQGMYIFPQYFFSQLPKIKIAFNSYIYKYSDSSLHGLEGSGSIKCSNNLDFRFLLHCLPSTCTFPNVSAMWSCSEMMAERKYYGRMRQSELELHLPASFRRPDWTQSFNVIF